MVTRPRALALRHPAAPADRTMLKTMLSFVAAVAVETNADSPRATASVEKMNFVFILLLCTPLTVLLFGITCPSANSEPAGVNP